MSANLSDDFKETVRARTDLVALIGEAVALHSRNGGREFAGLCPFHDDHNPSMKVYPDRQTYRCWVCQAGGDCFSWVMEHDKVEFRDALEILARRANLEVPKRRGGTSFSGDQKSQLFDALAWACRLYHQTLLSSPVAERARNYLRERGFTDETIKTFQLGYHPGGWNWLQQQARDRFSPQLLAAAKLVTPLQNGDGFGDFFRNRVLFPILNERGQPVSFGGRVLPGADDGFGKYQNGYESPVYHKSRVVFGLNLARETAKETGSLIVVEGYTDCITAHQHGIGNTVATCGTALTDLQVATIKRFAKKVVLVYDGDQPGRDAASKAVDRFLSQDVDLRILTLPADQDPAEFLESHGSDEFRRLAESAPEAWEYRYEVSRERNGTTSVDGRQRILDEMLTLLATAPNMSENIRESILLGRLSSRLNINESAVRDRYRELRQQSRRAPQRAGSADASPASHPDVDRLLTGKLSGRERAECELLEILFARPESAQYMFADVNLQLVETRAFRELLRIAGELHSASAAPSFERLMTALESPALKRLATWIDDQSRQKGVAGKLQHDESTDGCPLFLRRSIDQIQWRREEQSHEGTAVALSEPSDGTHRIDAATEALLRRSTEFHQRRATKKSPV